MLLEEPESFGAELIQEEWEEAKREAEKVSPGLVIFTDGSRLENEAAGYAVAWKNGRTWEGIKTHMGFNQEAYDAECAALARALKTAAEIAPNSEPHHNIYRCPSGNPEDVNRRAGTGAETCVGSETAHRGTPESSTGHYH